MKIETYMPTSSSISVSRGRESLVANTIRNLCSIPAKIVYLNSKTSSGWVSDETVNTVVDYLAENGLTDVHVSVNEYSPHKIFSRTFSNPNTSLITKVFLGIPFAFVQTLCPAKLFSPIDFYEPVSNTLHIFSNDSSLALATAAQANAMNEFGSPGFNLLAQICPGIRSIYNVIIGETALKSAADFAEAKESIDGARFSYHSMAVKTRLPYVADITLLDPVVSSILSRSLAWAFYPLVSSMLGEATEESDLLVKLVTTEIISQMLAFLVLFPSGGILTHIISKLESFSWKSKNVSYRNKESNKLSFA